MARALTGVSGDGVDEPGDQVIAFYWLDRRNLLRLVPKAVRFLLPE